MSAADPPIDAIDRALALEAADRKLATFAPSASTA